ncbi:MAG: phage tail sheath family protein [Paludibacteraceae bacterium]|nr:phage tail sheath family protein [Paludibacteraceae bacterium]
MAEYKTPGVYVEEISKFPPSVAGVATAIPAFIGFTAKCPSNQKGKPVKVTSMVDYEAKFGGAPTLKIEGDKLKNNEFVMYDSMRLFYDNGGGTCYVCSVGSYDQDASSGEDNVTNPTADTYLGSKNELVSELEKVDEVTLVLFPDAALVLDKDDLGAVHKAALNHCGKMGDRFAILDVKDIEDPNDKLGKTLSEFRGAVGTVNLSYGAAYYPYLKTTYTKEIGFDEMCNDSEISALLQTNLAAKSAYAQYNSSEIPGEKEIIAKAIISQIPEYAGKLAQYQAKAQVIPPSAAIAGIYAMTDANKGVWQAPANVSISGVSNVMEQLSDSNQGDMNVDPNAGKSINAIRSFSGKGIIVWGARTLDGNSNEWRYVPVRRLFNYIEESVQKSTSWAVFQPNDANTWVKVRCQIENFLSNLWRDGALAGSTPDKAFYVRVGLDETMTAQDILEGRMIVEIGLAAVRPAEFIILKFSHKLQEA